MNLGVGSMCMLRNSNRFTIKKLRVMEIDIRALDVLYVKLSNGTEVYIDNSTGENIVEVYTKSEEYEVTEGERRRTA